MESFWIILALLVGLATGIAVGRLWARARSAAADAADAAAHLAAEQVWRGQLEAAAREATEARERAAGASATGERLLAENAELKQQASRDQDVLRALAPVQAKLQEVQVHVAQLEKERAQQYAQLAQQLTSARETDEHLRASTQALAGALRSNSARGQWGEVELRRVLEISGLMRHVSFVEQATLSSATSQARGRPDVIVNLPGGKHLAIDAKVPMGAYLEASGLPADPADAQAPRRSGLLAEHARAVRGHIDTLAKRAYWEQMEASPEFTVMFIPTEALLGAALDADPNLMEYALSRAIAPATPASLLALLKTVATIWQHSTVTDEARELLELGRTLYTRLGKLGEHVGRLGSTIETVVTRYNQLVGSLEHQVLATARKFDAFDATSLAAPEIASERAQVRQLTSAELATAPLDLAAAPPGLAAAPPDLATAPPDPPELPARPQPREAE